MQAFKIAQHNQMLFTYFLSCRAYCLKTKVTNEWVFVAIILQVASTGVREHSRQLSAEIKMQLKEARIAFKKNNKNESSKDGWHAVSEITSCSTFANWQHLKCRHRCSVTITRVFNLKMNMLLCDVLTMRIQLSPCSSIKRQRHMMDPRLDR